ncbi:ArsR/SmtB family transcription factor [Amycolatopsis suaedae]|uniref:Transcriptional regulator n=1 Tax=Amycolatopsis suaedae TaxID=2510978 RepID=A0A4V2EMJ4_9PSEU|nr:DUF5937 family protein [Amycolatopsis suaedae]RZQ65275.1 transcriptional regulator [Amycolatopsis suaedae]
MIELVLTPAAAGRVRLAISPLEEALGAIRTVLGRRRHPSSLPWLRESAERARALPVAELFAVLGAGRYVTEFLSPPPRDRRTTVDDQLAELRGTPPEQVALELSMVDADLSGLPGDPATARDLLADQMELAWHELIAPHWPRLRDVLLADVDHRSRRLGEGGVALALAGLHPNIRLVNDVVTVRSATRSRLALDERGLLLLPSVFAWPTAGVIMVPPWQPTLVYPARGVASLWSAEPAAPDSLAAVVGRTKASLLCLLGEPAGTAALATRLGLSRGTVSEHLTALRDAGLLETSRHGREVRYRRTRVGDLLVRP